MKERSENLGGGKGEDEARKRNTEDKRGKYGTDSRFMLYKEPTRCNFGSIVN